MQLSSFDNSLTDYIAELPSAPRPLAFLIKVTLQTVGADRKDVRLQIGGFHLPLLVFSLRLLAPTEMMGVVWCSADKCVLCGVKCFRL